MNELKLGVWIAGTIFNVINIFLSKELHGRIGWIVASISSFVVVLNIIE